jgi:hypothetical protein
MDTGCQGEKILRVELSRRWIAVKGLVCGITMMVLSLPLAFYNIFLWIGIEVLALLCGLAVFLSQRRERGVYIFAPDGITVEGTVIDNEDKRIYPVTCRADLRLAQGPVERLLNVGIVRVVKDGVSLYGVSDFSLVRDYVENNYL